MATITRDWAWLPDLILDVVLQNLVSLPDYFRFSLVCKPWHSAAKAQKQQRRRIADSTPHKQVPLLMVPTEDRSHEWRSLYSATRGHDRLLLQTKLRIPINRRCCGSCYGWLAFLEEDYGITLYNPFTTARISLPPVSHLPDNYYDDEDRRLQRFQNFATKVVLSADPSTHPDEYMAAALISYPVFRTLAVIRPGRDNKDWTTFTTWTNYTGEELSTDLIFQGGSSSSSSWIYVTAYHGMLARANVDGLGTSGYEPVLEMVVPQWSDRICEITAPSYVVESSSGGELLMIVRYLEDPEIELSFVTVDIKVFKLVWGADGGIGNSSFVEVEDLNGDAVFLGDNYSIAIPAREHQGCEPDTVYYTDDYIELPSHYLHLGPHDMGKFNVKSRKFGTHYVPSIAQNREMPPPVWIFPRLIDEGQL